MRRLLGIGATPLVLVAALAAPGQALKPEIGYRARPFDYGILCDTVTFRARDGVALKGWYYPAQDSVGIADSLLGRVMPVPSALRPAPRPYHTLDESRRPTVVICDGDAGNMSYQIFYAWHFFIHGYNVFTFDWRGFGESDPWSVDSDQLVYTEYLRDYDAALDYLKTRPDVDTARVGLMGFSTGSYLSFAMAARRSDVGALVGRGTITSFDDLLANIARLDPQRHWHAPPDYPRDLLPLAAAPRIHIPVLLVVGEQDERTPVEMSRRVYRALVGPKELWVVGGADHGGVRGPEMVGYPDFFVRARSFFDRHLKPVGGEAGARSR